MAKHELKTIQPFFDDVWAGRKEFEIRKADRPFAFNDWLNLREWDGEKFTGRSIKAVVIYITSLSPMLPDYVGMGIHIFAKHHQEEQLA